MNQQLFKKKRPQYFVTSENEIYLMHQSSINSIRTYKCETPNPFAVLLDMILFIKAITNTVTLQLRQTYNLETIYTFSL